MNAQFDAVTVRFFAAAKAATGCAEAQVPQGTIEQICAGLMHDFANLVTVLPACSFLVDGAQPLDGIKDTLVHKGSSLDVLPPFAGG